MKNDLYFILLNSMLNDFITCIMNLIFFYRYSHPTVTSGARPEYIPLPQQQPIISRPYDHDMSKSYSPGTAYVQATSPGRR